MEQVKIKEFLFKRGTRENLDKSNIVLKRGEIVLNTDSYLFRIGDGTHAIKDLPEASYTRDGDIFFNTEASNFELIQKAKGAGYYMLIDDGRDEDGNPKCGYQWLKTAWPKMYYQLFDGCMIFSSDISSTEKTLVRDDTTACKICGGVDYNELSKHNSGDSSLPVYTYQFEANNDNNCKFSQYYEDFVWKNDALRANGLIGYKGMMVTSTNEHLNSASDMQTVFGGTWVQWATKAECGVNQFVCTAHTNTMDHEWTKKLGNFKGDRISLYLSELDTSTDEKLAAARATARTYANNVYGGDWNNIEADEKTSKVFQLIQTGDPVLSL